MTIRLVADIQNRLFWLALVGLLSAAFPLLDRTSHPEMDNDCHGAG